MEYPLPTYHTLPAVTELQFSSVPDLGVCHVMERNAPANEKPVRSEWPRTRLTPAQLILAVGAIAVGVLVAGAVIRAVRNRNR